MLVQRSSRQKEIEKGSASEGYLAMCWEQPPLVSLWQQIA